MSESTVSLGFECAWGLFALVWILAMRHTKPAQRTISIPARLAQFLLLVVGYILIGFPSILPAVLPGAIWTRSLTVATCGLALTSTGVLFAIWARWTLGSNWSMRPMVQKGHQLVIRGPYALVRHPIYTGLLLATVGTALAVDAWRCLLGIAIVLITLALKMRQEERLMMATFPADYPAYRARVKALLPGIL